MKKKTDLNIEQLRSYCLYLPHVTEDIKWGNDLCFSVGGKMFCVCALQEPITVPFKVREEDFETLTATNDIIPAPYLARYKWIFIQTPTRFSKKEWARYLLKSYELIKANLPKKILKQL